MRCVDSGRVAIFDATNSTRKRRAWLKAQLENLPVKLLFIESVCTDEAIVDKNIWNAKVTLPEYAVRGHLIHPFALSIRFYRRKREKAIFVGVPLLHLHMWRLPERNCTSQCIWRSPLPLPVPASSQEMKPEEAFKDFRQRIEFYRVRWPPLAVLLERS